MAKDTTDTMVKDTTDTVAKDTTDTVSMTFTLYRHSGQNHYRSKDQKRYIQYIIVKDIIHTEHPKLFNTQTSKRHNVHSATATTSRLQLH